MTSDQIFHVFIVTIVVKILKPLIFKENFYIGGPDGFKNKLLRI